MQQQVVINNAELGSWALNVYDVYKNTDNTYNFEGCDSAVCLRTGEVHTDAQLINRLLDYVEGEGYAEQSINKQCAALYAAWAA